MPAIFPAVAAALAEGAATTAVGYGLSQLTGSGTPKINIPPPPGAAMIDQTGAQAAADMRRRQAAAGGLQSTIGAGANPTAGAQLNAATGGGKQLLGQ